VQETGAYTAPILNPLGRGVIGIEDWLASIVGAARSTGGISLEATHQSEWISLGAMEAAENDDGQAAKGLRSMSASRSGREIRARSMKANRK
jgi:hypothetical protein